MNTKRFSTIAGGSLAVGAALLLLVALLAYVSPDVAAAPAADGIMINEFRIDQSGGDDDEYFELAGTGGASLDDLTYLVIGDGEAGSGVVEAVVGLDGNSVPANGLFVAAESTFTLGTADFTTDLNFENSDNVTHLLVSGFTGSDGDDLDTDDDGTLDAMPWSTVEDCVSLVEQTDGGDQVYCETVGPDGSFVPAHVYRCPDSWNIGGFGLGSDDTPGDPNGCALSINEIRIDQPSGDDDEYFELTGAAGASLDGLTYVVIGDGAAGSGVVEAVISLDGNIVPADGYFLAVESTFTTNPGSANLTTTLNFENSDNVTHLLVSDFSGSDGDDLDTDDDGILDSTPWAVVEDCLSLVESVDSGEKVYCETTLGPDGSFVPAHVFYCMPEWRIGAFEPVGETDTPGYANACGGDLTVDKMGPTGLTTEANQQVVYTIVVENQSPIPATDLIVTDNLPAGLQYQSDNAEVNPVAAGDNVYIWMLPDLAAMSSTSFQITATTGAFPLEAGTVFTNTVEVDTTLAGDDPANNVAETAATVFPLVYIHDIQGSGDSTPMPGAIVNIQAIVVGDFQDNDGDLFDTDLDGFFVQEQMADYDDDSTTSEGVFVYAPGAIDVVEGDVVCLTGEVGEYSDQTQLTLQGDLKICGESALPAPVPLTLPVSDLSDFEQYEGMLVTFPQALVISEYYNYDRYNEMVLAEPFVDERPFTPSAYLDPTTEAAAIADAMSLTARSRITLDDARSAQNPPLLRHPNGDPYTLDNRFRGGDRVQDATGVLGEGFGLYRLQPTTAATYIQENERPDSSPAVGGSVQVSAFNVLNYFLTLDDGSDICGPNLDMECRGADTQEEFDRQRAKILAALEEIEADVFGLVELENTTGVTPTADLVAGLNDALGAGTYAHIETGTIGGDAIKLGIIYKPATVTPLADFAVLDAPDFLDPNDTGVPKNRAALVQTFQDNHTGETFTVVVNHLKSKGSDCGGPPDDDPVQGNCNLTRTMAADYLVDWLATNPTGTGMGNNLIIGDLNAYDKEDPIDEILEGPDDTLGTDDDYGDLLFQFQGEYAYSYVFDGQFGYLDYAMASQQLLPQVTGAGAWHINADESDVLDYDMSFKPDEQEALFVADPFRASDHDPVIVGLFKLRVYLPAVFN